MKNLGLFIGASVMPMYASQSMNGIFFKEQIIDNIFIQYKKALEFQVRGAIDENLYTPLHYYTFGHFHLLSICLVDDFHFANFSYHPYSYYAYKNIEELNFAQKRNIHDHLLFEYQVTNGMNIVVSDDINSLAHYNKWMFVAMCRIKINSSLILDFGGEIISEIKLYLFLKFEEKNDIEIIISESVSWHELTILFFGNSIHSLINLITEIRSYTFRHLNHYLNDKYTETIKGERNLFVDTHTTYGIHPELHISGSIMNEAYIKSNLDSSIEMMCRIHVKTGHEKNLLGFIRTQFQDEINVASIKRMDGRTDFIFNYNKPSIVNYIKYWEKISKIQSECFQGNIDETILSHFRIWHSNLTLIEDSSETYGSDLNYSSSTQTIKSLKFSTSIITSVSDNLLKLNVSKDLHSIIRSLFSNFNEIICDSTLYQYFIDVKPLLIGLYNYLNLLTDYSDDTYNGQRLKEYRSLGNLTKILYTFVNLWQLVYQNRFQESKRFGYNSDSKAEFNGGAHQIIHIYDALYKLVVKTFKIPSRVHDVVFVPIATYGSNRTGIASTINYLHLNYFQLFQPEFFLFALTKESINQQFDRFYVTEFEIPGNPVKPVESILRIRKILANYISDEPNPIMRRILYEFCPPEKVKESVNYILTYTSFYEIAYKEDRNLFVFWFWQNYLQESENYNVDGTIKLSQLKRVLFLFLFSQSHLGYTYSLTEFNGIIMSKKLARYLSQSSIDQRDNLFETCLNVIAKIEKSIHDEYYPLLEAMSDITTSLKNKSSNNYKELNRISIQYLRWLMNEITQKGSNATYERDPSTGKGIHDDNYCRGVFDPHGGLFILDRELRKVHLSERMKVMRSLSIIAIKEKIELFNSIKQWETSLQLQSDF